MDYNFNPSGPAGDRPLSGIRKGLFLRKMIDSPTFHLSI